MKKFFALCLTVFAAWLVCPVASAYNPQMAEFAKALNEKMDENVSVLYEDPNLVFNFPESFFSNEEAELFASFSDADMQLLAAPMKEAIASEMSDEDVSLLGTLLKQCDAKFIVRLNVRGEKKNIVLTAADFMQ